MRAAIADSLADATGHAVVFAIGSFDGTEDAGLVARTTRRHGDCSTIQIVARGGSKKPG